MSGKFPSPCGVRRVRDISPSSSAVVPGMNCQFPSPCGVRRVRDLTADGEQYIVADVSVPLRGKEGAGQQPEKAVAEAEAERFRPLAG